MTKKGLIILTSILVSVVAVLAVLFGAVFCLRNIDVVVTDEETFSISNDAIIEKSGFKKGSSIFMLDKQTATNNLESKYPELKVVQIKTTDVMSIEIHVRTRQKMFYARYNDKFYVLDEELKVLDILEIEPTGLIYIDAETEGNKKLDITGNTEKGNFISTQQIRTSTYNLYTSMHNAVIIDKGQGTEHYAERTDIKTLLAQIAFRDEFTDEGEKFCKLVVKTTEGATIEIVDPLHNCEDKVNGCFAKYFTLADKSTGTIKAKADGTFVN